MRIAPVVGLSEEPEATLTKLARLKRTSVRLLQRARIVLLAAQGQQHKDITESIASASIFFGLYCCAPPDGSYLPA